MLTRLSRHASTAGVSLNLFTRLGISKQDAFSVCTAANAVDAPLTSAPAEPIARIDLRPRLGQNVATSAAHHRPLPDALPSWSISGKVGSLAVPKPLQFHFSLLMARSARLWNLAMDQVTE